MLFYLFSNICFGQWSVMENMKTRTFSSYLSSATIRPYAHSLSPSCSCIVSCRWHRVQRSATSDNTNQRLVSDTTTERRTTHAISSVRTRASWTKKKDVSSTRYRPGRSTFQVYLISSKYSSLFDKINRFSESTITLCCSIEINLDEQSKTRDDTRWMRIIVWKWRWFIVH